MASSPPVTGSAVFLRGSFNPAIFQPSWFAREGLISFEEADTATVNLIHAEISSFETSGFRLQVTSDSFEVSAAGRPFTDLVRDIAYGTFTILKHTPVSAMGMNNYEHFQARSEDAWHHVGHSFAPKEFWKPLLKNPGMQSLVIRGERNDELSGYVDVRVEPSVLILPAGVFVLVNNSVVLREGHEGEEALFFMDVLQREWGQVVEHATRIIDAVRQVAR